MSRAPRRYEQLAHALLPAWVHFAEANISYTLKTDKLWWCSARKSLWFRDVWGWGNPRPPCPDGSCLATTPRAWLGARFSKVDTSRLGNICLISLFSAYTVTLLAADQLKTNEDHSTHPPSSSSEKLYWCVQRSQRSSQSCIVLSTQLKVKELYTPLTHKISWGDSTPTMSSLGSNISPDVY